MIAAEHLPAGVRVTYARPLRPPQLCSNHRSRLTRYPCDGRLDVTICQWLRPTRDRRELVFYQYCRDCAPREIAAVNPADLHALIVYGRGVRIRASRRRR